MKLEAASRLHAVDVDYRVYCRMVASLDHSKVQAFSMTLPGPLKKLWGEIKQLAAYLKEAKDIGLAAVISAFKQRSVFTLLKGLGFSLVKLSKALIALVKLPSSALFAALDALAEAFSNTKLMKSLDVRARLERLEAVIRKHPILSKITGAVIAGLIFVIYIKAPFIGDVEFDFDLVESMISALKGNYSLADFFTSPDAIHTIGVLLFGGLTGGFSLLDYGAGAMAKTLKFLGSHAEDVSAVLLAIFYAGARRARRQIKIPQELK